MAVWTAGTGLRWSVRLAAILVAFTNLFVLVLWVVGLEVLAGDGASLGEAVPSMLVATIAGLAASEAVLRVFELPRRGFRHRYRAAVAGVCLGGVIMGALLAALYAVDGTLGADPTQGLYATLSADPLAVLGLVPVGLLGAGVGLVFGLAEGLVLGLPLAAALGAPRGG